MSWHKRNTIDPEINKQNRDWDCMVESHEERRLVGGQDEEEEHDYCQHGWNKSPLEKKGCHFVKMENAVFFGIDFSVALI